MHSPSDSAGPPDNDPTGRGDAPPAGLAERSRAWQMSGDPASLWPGLDPRSLPPAAAAIERGVAALLAGERATLGRADGSDAAPIGIAGLVTGTGPLLGRWVERGRLDVSPPLAELLARHLEHGRRRMVRIARGVRPALAALVAAGVRPVVMKGFHTAHLYFPEPGVRPLADVDLVVLPEEVERSAGALAAAGFSADPSVLRPYKGQWHPAGMDQRIWSLEYWHARSPWRLELHDAASFGQLVLHRARLAHPATNAAPWSHDGVPLRVPAEPLLVILLAIHLSGELYSMRLLRLVELVLVIRNDHAAGRLDWAAVEEELARRGVARFAWPALALAEQLAPGTIPERVLSGTRRASTGLARRVVAQLTPATPLLQERVSLAERLMWAAGPWQLLRRMALMVAPPPGMSLPALADVYRGRLRRLLTGRVSWRQGRASGSGRV